MMGDSLRVSVRIKEEICSAVVVPDFLLLIINISVHHHGRGDDPAGHHHDVPAAQDGVHPDTEPGGGALAAAAPARSAVLCWQVSLGGDNRVRSSSVLTTARVTDGLQIMNLTTRLRSDTQLKWKVKNLFHSQHEKSQPCAGQFFKSMFWICSITNQWQYNTLHCNHRNWRKEIVFATLPILWIYVGTLSDDYVIITFLPPW